MDNIGKTTTTTQRNKDGKKSSWHTHLATILKEYRKDHNLLQRQLGELLFVSGETIWKYEHEKCEPGLDFLVRLARLTNAGSWTMCGMRI